MPTILDIKCELRRLGVKAKTSGLTKAQLLNLLENANSYTPFLGKKKPKTKTPKTPKVKKTPKMKKQDSGGYIPFAL